MKKTRRHQAAAQSSPSTQQQQQQQQAGIERSVLALWRSHRLAPDSAGQKEKLLWDVLLSVATPSVSSQPPTPQTAIDGNNLSMTQNQVQALCQVIEWLFVDTSPHACLAFLHPAPSSDAQDAEEKEQVFCFLGPVTLRYLVKALCSKEHPYVMEHAELAKPAWMTTMWKRLRLAIPTNRTAAQKRIGVAVVLLRCLATLERHVHAVTQTKGAAGKMQRKQVPTTLQAGQCTLIEYVLLLSDDAKLSKGMASLLK